MTDPTPRARGTLDSSHRSSWTLGGLVATTALFAALLLALLYPVVAAGAVATAAVGAAVLAGVRYHLRRRRRRHLCVPRTDVCLTV